MKRVEKMFTLRDDTDISTFMETHDGFELIEHGLAEIEEPPPTFTRGKSYVEVDPETFRLLDDLVASGRCSDMQHALRQAVYNYTHTVLPPSPQPIRRARY